MSKSYSNSGLLRAALSAQRRELKIELWRERKDECMTWPYYTLKPEAARALCVYCKRPIVSPDDCVMHEVFIKRNYLPVKLQCKVMHEYNCVLAENDCHHQQGQTREFKLRAARAQYKRYGRDKIVAWVESLNLRQTVYIPSVEEVTLAAVADGICLTQEGRLSVNPYWLMEEEL